MFFPSFFSVWVDNFYLNLWLLHFFSNSLPSLTGGFKVSEQLCCVQLLIVLNHDIKENTRRVRSKWLREFYRQIFAEIWSQKLWRKAVIENKNTQNLQIVSQVKASLEFYPELFFRIHHSKTMAMHSVLSSIYIVILVQFLLSFAVCRKSRYFGNGIT